MEPIFFLIDIIAVIWVLYWSIENDKLGPDDPTTGMFAYRKTVTRRPKRAAPRRGKTRARAQPEKRHG